MMGGGNYGFPSPMVGFMVMMGDCFVCHEFMLWNLGFQFMFSVMSVLYRLTIFFKKKQFFRIGVCRANQIWRKSGLICEILTLSMFRGDVCALK